MENLPNGISAETEDYLRTLYQRYLDHDKEMADLAAEIEDTEARLREVRVRRDTALTEYHRKLNRIARETSKERKGLSKRTA